MDKFFLTIEEFHELLNQWQGQAIHISKHELDDIDETMMDLNKLSYRKNDGTFDDYESKYTMHLNGDGKVLTETNELQTLPDNQYVIPLEDDTLYEYDGHQFIISTDRGIYKVKLHLPEQ